MEKPYIILTLRRTGGTSLMSLMSDISKFPSVQHEPLNIDRIWGAATRSYSMTLNEEDLRSALHEHLKRKPNVKHCIDVVPPTITKVLIEECKKLDYSFFFLSRRSEKSRLKSLFLALSTGAWGYADAKRIYPLIASGDLVPEPIDLKKAQVRIRQDVSTLGQTLSLLRNRKVQFEWLLFEEIYANPESKLLGATNVASLMGVDSQIDARRLERFCQEEGQKSQSIKEFVPGFFELLDFLEKLVLE